MATARKSRLSGWKWTAFILGALWVSIGCGPANITYLLLPFSDDRIPPKCKLASSKEVTVCIVTNFATLEARPDAVPAEGELAELLAQQLRTRATENKEKIKVVPTSKVRSYQNQADAGTRPLHDIGKHFKADYVVALEISNLSLYEYKSAQQLYRGNTEINVQVVDVNKPAGEGTIFTEPYRREYPTGGAKDASEMSVATFRARFLNTVAADLARLFVAYPSDQRHVMD